MLLQTGMRVDEMTRLQIRDLVLHDRSGYAKIVDSKGHKYREVPLNATARRAVKETIRELGVRLLKAGESCGFDSFVGTNV